MLDTFSRNINYLRLSITDLCNLRCRYCMPSGGIEKKEHSKILRIEELTEIAEAAVSCGINKIRLTGGEPLVRKGLIELIQNIRKIDGLKTLTLTTNGILLPDMAFKLKDAGLDRVNISLDSLNREKFKWITRLDKLDSVLKGIDTALKAGLTPLKINSVLIKDFNEDEILEFKKLAEYLDIEIRFIELMPVGEASGWTEDRYLPNKTVFDKVPGMVKIDITEKGSPAEVWQLPEGKGRFGFINPISHKFCGDCNRLRITSEGKLLSCLHSNRGMDIREALDEGKTLAEVFAEGIRMKPGEHNLEMTDFEKTIHSMHEVGG